MIKKTTSPNKTSVGDSATAAVTIFEPWGVDDGAPVILSQPASPQQETKKKKHAFSLPVQCFLGAKTKQQPQPQQQEEARFVEWESMYFASPQDQEEQSGIPASSKRHCLSFLLQPLQHPKQLLQSSPQLQQQQQQQQPWPLPLSPTRRQPKRDSRKDPKNDYYYHDHDYDDHASYDDSCARSLPSTLSKAMISVVTSSIAPSLESSACSSSTSTSSSSSSSFSSLGTLTTSTSSRCSASDASFFDDYHDPFFGFGFLPFGASSSSYKRTSWNCSSHEEPIRTTTRTTGTTARTTTPTTTTTTPGRQQQRSWGGPGCVPAAATPMRSQHQIPSTTPANKKPEPPQPAKPPPPQKTPYRMASNRDLSSSNSPTPWAGIMSRGNLQPHNSSRRRRLVNKNQDENKDGNVSNHALRTTKTKATAQSILAQPTEGGVQSYSRSNSSSSMGAFDFSFVDYWLEGMYSQDKDHDKKHTHPNHQKKGLLYPTPFHVNEKDEHTVISNNVFAIPKRNYS
ncbi:hypothetical protein ACA910_004664 [Epithemia clementina (nom. ined.)]